jgi:hypothetical protein
LEFGWPKFAKNSGKNKKTESGGLPDGKAEKPGREGSIRKARRLLWNLVQGAFLLEVFSNPTTKEEPRMPSAMRLRT